MIFWFSINKILSIFSAKKLLWVAIIQLFFVSKVIFLNILKINNVLFLSKFPVGSSASINLGLFDKARPMATLWDSPPDNLAGL